MLPRINGKEIIDCDLSDLQSIIDDSSFAENEYLDYELDSTVIERMARNLETFSDWINPVFSYDETKVRGKTKLQGTDIYMSTGFSASDCVSFIKGMLKKYDLNIDEDFVYSARSNRAEAEGDQS